MALYVKNTDTLIIGTLETMVCVAEAKSLSDEGWVRWTGHVAPASEVTDNYDGTETILRDGQLVWISEDGGEYATDQIEDRREDGTVIAYRPLADEPVRPVTKSIRNHWRVAVGSYATTLSAEDWGNTLTICHWLEANGLRLTNRNPDLLPDTPGALQVTGAWEKLPTIGERDSYKVVVGDDLEDLLMQAIVTWNLKDVRDPHRRASVEIGFRADR